LCLVPVFGRQEWRLVVEELELRVEIVVVFDLERVAYGFIINGFEENRKGDFLN